MSVSSEGVREVTLGGVDGAGRRQWVEDSAQRETKVGMAKQSELGVAVTAVGRGSGC